MRKIYLLLACAILSLGLSVNAANAPATTPAKAASANSHATPPAATHADSGSVATGIYVFLGVVGVIASSLASLAVLSRGRKK